MFDKPYSFDFLGSKATMVPDPVQKVQYRFKAKYRRYLVTLEVFSYGVVAVKYCDLKDKDAGNRFDKVFNDNDAFRVITTCLYIMLDYWRKHPETTFAFYAVPRRWTEQLLRNKNITEKQKKQLIDRYKKVRFRIYQYAMLNLFPPNKFIQLRDPKNSIYVLLNKKQKKPKTTVKKLGEYLAEHYELIFNPQV